MLSSDKKVETSSTALCSWPRAICPTMAVTIRASNGSVRPCSVEGTHSLLLAVFLIATLSRST